jgi:GntR family transcriptional regulator
LNTEKVKDTPNLQTSSFLYLQIAQSLLDWIQAEKLKPGDRLPTERDLSERLRVNRATLRQALRILQDRGIIERRQGKGTFVATPKIERQAGKFVPFTKSMQKKGYQTEAKLITLEKNLADISTAEDLQLSIGQLIYFIHRVRYLNHEPVLVERLFVPAVKFPDLEQFNLAERSLYEVMETEYGIVIHTARQSLEAVPASDYEAQLLGIRAGVPMMLERRVVYDREGVPVERARDLFRGDRFRFITELATLEF